MALRTTGSRRIAQNILGIRGISSASLPDLPYDYNALAPVIIPEIMELHHKKHHQAYITNLNASLEKQAEADQKDDLDAVIALQPAIKFNGGGKYPGSLYDADDFFVRFMLKFYFPWRKYLSPLSPLSPLFFLFHSFVLSLLFMRLMVIIDDPRFVDQGYAHPVLALLGLRTYT